MSPWATKGRLTVPRVNGQNTQERPDRVSRVHTLRSVQAKLIKIGAKVVAHSRRIIFQMAEVAAPRALFEAILKRIGELAPVTG
jgi:hypothetical protein